MPPTTGYSFDDVVLVPFPFTDQSGLKRRPAVAPSVVKPVVTTIERLLVLKRLGRLQQADLRSLRAKLGAILG